MDKNTQEFYDRLKVELDLSNTQLRTYSNLSCLAKMIILIVFNWLLLYGSGNQNNKIQNG
jgi:hypothetical protein